MKKFIALFLALVMVCSLSVSALADGEGEYADTVYLSWGPVDTYDPYGSTMAEPQILTNMTFDTLTYVDPDSGEICPELAKSWEDVSEEGNGGDWLIHLEEGVKFHDGSPFTAEDVKFTWEYVATGAGNVVKPLAATAYVKEYEIVDDYTIIFHLVSPMPDFPSYLEAKIYSKTAFESMEKEDAVIIGTGPYYFDMENTQKGVQVTLSRFEDYWRGLTDYPTKQFIYREIADENTRIAALMAGEVDLLFAVSAAGYSSLSADSSLNIQSRSGANSYYIGFNYKNPAFEDVEVRQAFAQAISKDDLVAVACEGGIGGVASYNFCPPSGLGYAEVDAIQYDPEAAKAVFDAKEITGQTFTILYNGNFPIATKTAEVIQANMSDLGVNIEMRDAGGANWSQVKASQEGYDLFVEYGAYQGALLYNFNRFFYSGGSSNVYGFQSDEYEQLQDNVSAQTTWEDMLTEFATLEQWVATNVPIIPTYYENMICAARPGIGGLVIAPTSNYLDFSTVYLEK